MRAYWTAAKRYWKEARRWFYLVIALLFLINWRENLKFGLDQFQLLLDSLSEWLHHPYTGLIFYLLAIIALLIGIQKTKEAIKREGAKVSADKEKTLSDVKKLLKEATSIPLLLARERQQEKEVKQLASALRLAEGIHKTLSTKLRRLQKNNVPVNSDIFSRDIVAPARELGSAISEISAVAVLFSYESIPTFVPPQLRSTGENYELSKNEDYIATVSKFKDEAGAFLDKLTEHQIVESEKLGELRRNIDTETKNILKG